MTRPTPIRIGDKFKVGETIWEVIRTLPGGKIELFDRVKTRFHDRYHREIKDWARV